MWIDQQTTGVLISSKFLNIYFSLTFLNMLVKTRIASLADNQLSRKETDHAAGLPFWNLPWKS